MGASVAVETVVDEIFVAYEDEVKKYRTLREPSYWSNALDSETDARLLAFLNQVVIFIDATGTTIAVPFRELIKAELYDPNNL